MLSNSKQIKNCKTQNQQLMKISVEEMLIDRNPQVLSNHEQAYSKTYFFKKKRGRLLFFLFASSFLFMQSCSSDDAPSTFETITYQDFRVEMRNLWADHMEWTFSTVDAFFHDADGLGAKLNRLLLNQQEIGDAVMPFFGQEPGDKLAALLTEHIEDAVPVLTAAQAGDDAELAEALDEWYANAQEVGDHFAQLNPKDWAQPHMRDMWKTHITQTVDYSVALMIGDRDQALDDYQLAYDHMMDMSDLISHGIGEFFPDKF